MFSPWCGIVQVIWPDAACERRRINYIGIPTTTIQERMQRQTYSGNIKYHYRTAHDRKATAAELVINTEVIHWANSMQQLAIAASVNIAVKRPILNVHREFDNVLTSCKRRNTQTEQTEDTRQNGLKNFPAVETRLRKGNRWWNLHIVNNQIELQVNHRVRSGSN